MLAEDACLPYAPLKISRENKGPAEGDVGVKLFSPLQVTGTETNAWFNCLDRWVLLLDQVNLNSQHDAFIRRIAV